MKPKGYFYDECDYGKMQPVYTLHACDKIFSIYEFIARLSIVGEMYRHLCKAIT